MDPLSEETSKWMEDVQAAITYRFRDSDLLIQALTHRSHAHENLQSKLVENERLEFLGDAVLNFVISHLLIERFADKSAGELTRMRASIVNEKALARTSKRIGLGRFILLGKGENQSGGREKSSILADCYEAVIGAVYLDGGYGEVFQLVKSHFSGVLTRLRRKVPRQNFKNLLQERTQSLYHAIPQYSLVKESGPDHDKEFKISVSVDGVVMGLGKGRTKKDAEQGAAERALSKLTSNMK
ncbi:MAG: ribonuclease III [Proteobacteria bacterium]|nr:ribonuclease III [Pseudomonadota bacterium]